MRNIAKLLDEYQRRFSGSRKNRYAFRRSDLRGVMDLSIIDGKMDTFMLVSNALEAGFVVGYHAAQMDAKEKNTGM